MTDKDEVRVFTEFSYLILILSPHESLLPLMRRFNQILHSSRAAIDLASIMVGVIIIGLIGGVIAATVFAVIPWSQDSAAKHQLESIHTAENAFFGLSSDSNQSLKNGDGTVGSFKNTFTGSTILDANSLLTISKDGAYCVIPASTGKDYHAYVKSGSGKWFYALNSKKSPQLLAADINPCVSTVGTPAGQTPGTVDTNIDDGKGDVPITAVKPPVATYDFENGQQGFTPSNFAYSSTMSVTKSYYHSGKQSLYVFTDGAPSDITRGTSVTVSNIEAGQTYRVSGWIYWDQRYTNSVSIDVVAFGNSYRAMKGTSPAPTYQWTQFSFDVTPTSSNGVVNSNLVFNSRIAAYFNNTIYLDDISVEKI